MMNYKIDKDLLPVIFVHGFLGNIEDWNPIRNIVKNKFTFINYNLPGHSELTEGTSKSSMKRNGQPHNFETTARSLRDLCKINFYKKKIAPILVGYSMGGRLALYTALHYSSVTSGVIIISSDPGIKQKSSRSRRLSDDKELSIKLKMLNNFSTSEWFEQWYSAPLFGNLKQNPHYQKLLYMRKKIDLKKAADTLVNLSVGNQPSLWNLMKSYSKNGLFIAGALDKKYRRIGEAVGELGSQWSFTVCDNAAHAVHIEQPQTVANLISDFVYNFINNKSSTN